MAFDIILELEDGRIISERAETINEMNSIINEYYGQTKSIKVENTEKILKRKVEE